MGVVHVFRTINGYFFFTLLSFEWERVLFSVRQEMILYIQFRLSLASTSSKF